MSMIKVEDLRKEYGKFVAVKGINFEVEEGEIFGFLGPNGAGKTTTINMLIGLARATSGRIFYLGKEYTKKIKSAQHFMGIVPDESNLYDEMNGFDNLSFCGALYGMGKKEREARAKELLQRFQLHETGRKPFKKYSRGMKRKLTIAAAIIHRPRLLFLDETTTGLDVVSAREIRQLILHLNQQGTTIFLTTHYIEEAQKLCNHVAFIVQGELVRYGTIAELMKEDENKRVVQITYQKGDLDINHKLKEAFPNYQVQLENNHTLKIYGKESLNLVPVMRFFEKLGIMVYEARVLGPSLEDVFVRETGVKIMEMGNGKGGGRRE